MRAGRSPVKYAHSTPIRSLTALRRFPVLSQGAGVGRGLKPRLNSHLSRIAGFGQTTEFLGKSRLFGKAKRHPRSAVTAYLCVSPVKSQSTDFPNSFLIASSTAAPGSFSPFSRAER